MHPLIDLERKAFALRNSGQVKEAAELFATLVQMQPDWEHGNGFYSLACCYEELKDLERAEIFFRKALEYEPKNTIFLGGYASFLYLHGDPRQAFEWHLKLLSAEQEAGDESGAKSTKIALQALGGRLGFSDQMIQEKISQTSG